MAKSTLHTVARERWRADLNEYEAHVRRNGGLDYTAKEEEAALRRGYADLLEDFDAARKAFNAEMAAAHARWVNDGTGNERRVQDYIHNTDVITAYRDAEDQLRQVRGAWKGIDTFLDGVQGRDARLMTLLAEIGVRPDRAPQVSARRPCGIVNNFIEPTDEELIPT